MARFVDVYSKTTGEKTRVPEHWIGHPKLGKNISLTPRAKARESATIASTQASATDPAQTNNTQEDGNAEDHR